MPRLVDPLAAELLFELRLLSALLLLLLVCPPLALPAALRLEPLLLLAAPLLDDPLLRLLPELLALLLACPPDDFPPLLLLEPPLFAPDLDPLDLLLRLASDFAPPDFFPLSGGASGDDSMPAGAEAVGAAAIGMASAAMVIAHAAIPNVRSECRIRW